MHWLVSHGFTPVLVIAAPPVKLNIKRSKKRITPQGIPCMLPSELASNCGARYVETPHNSELTKSALREMDVQVAVILGARRISKDVIDALPLGILNMHDGRLPDNRGLDCIKWAAALSIPQEVTAHLIDEHLDRGRKICSKEVEVLPGDTFMDVWLRAQAVQRQLMIQSLRKLSYGERDFPLIGKGNYRSSIPQSLEDGLKL